MRPSHRSFVAPVLSLTTLAVLAGCGLGDAEGLFGGSEGTGAAGGEAATTTATTGATGGGPSASSSTTATAGSTTATAGSGGGDGGAGGATTTTTTTTTATSASSSTSSGGATLDCGSDSCPVAAESACCHDGYKLHGAPQSECVTGTDANDGCMTHLGSTGLETRIECQLPGHCSAGVCCGKRTFFSYNGSQSAYYSLVSCTATCDGQNVTLCDPAAAINACPIAQTNNGPVQTVCKPSGLLPAGYSVCGMP